jgi:vacuolar protein 8
MSGIVTTCRSCLSAVDQWCSISACLGGGRSRDGIYEATLADNEREAVSDLLSYLENVRLALEDSRPRGRAIRSHYATRC